MKYKYLTDFEKIYKLNPCSKRKEWYTVTRNEKIFVRIMKIWLYE